VNQLTPNSYIEDFHFDKEIIYNDASKGKRELAIGSNYIIAGSILPIRRKRKFVKLIN